MARQKNDAQSKSYYISMFTKKIKKLTEKSIFSQNENDVIKKIKCVAFYFCTNVIRSLVNKIFLEVYGKNLLSSPR